MAVKKTLSTLVSWACQIGLIILLVLVISILIVQTYDINDISMEPTFDWQGNRVIVFLTPYLFNATPQYGDVVVIDSRVDRKRTFHDRIIESPLLALIFQTKNEHMWVKRVIGLPGDTLEYNLNRVYLNGRELDEDYINEEMRRPFEPVVVPEGFIFVMGDNRNKSTDSRVIGPVPIENTQGRVVMRYFPFNKISFY